MSFVEKWEAETDEIKDFIGAASVDGLKASVRRIEEELDRRGSGVAMRTLVLPDSWYERLDVGIRFPVRVLHAAGIETGQSCEGGAGHCYHDPSVDLASGTGTDGFSALSALASHGIDVLSVAVVWGVVDGLPTDRIWRLTLRRAYHDRAHERPMFVRGFVPELRDPIAKSA